MEEYIVTEETKKLWTVELDLLEKFKEICAKHSLRYYALAGTLLGAVRHRGFIPWDDDIDVAMPWEDCKKLMEIAPREVSFPYFFQDHLTEKNGEISTANTVKLRLPSGVSSISGSGGRSRGAPFFTRRSSGFCVS